ncbi:hypothetical protein CYLTODRAFT_456995 [Cylindrobasidium torrendii FP15055 ss-10]|uniref:Uncharacterized protein n=1 Tax=Cylindrobasidium torrendii FP15055 ss-10 TaxID=1314674 RepID=A0A0D7B586_9AGAR|nr:hypothetical protein CYLTODRAFT_456995 [Cylindrobasidium torrendii FP15055 ss-10]
MSFCLTLAPSPDLDMEDRDTFCGLTGGSCIEWDDVYPCEIMDAWRRLPYEHRLTVFEPSPEILKELYIPAEDIEASVDLVLLARIQPDGAFDVDVSDDMSEFKDSVPRRGSIGAFVNLCCTRAHPAIFRLFHCENERFVGKLRTLQNKQDPPMKAFKEDKDYTDLIISDKYYVRLDMFRILLGRFPEIEPHMVYHAINLEPYKDPEWEDCNIRERWARWLNCADADENEDCLESFWLELLSRTDLTKEEIGKEAWMGRGRLYYHSRADRFPHADPLPVLGSGSNATPFARFTLDLFYYFCEDFLECRDVAVLAILDRATRAFILPHIDKITENIIRRYEAHLLPIGTTAYDRGMEEFDEWKSLWNDGPVPWCAYAQECRRSPHMKNRARFWRIAARIRELIGNVGMLPAIP